MPKHRSTPINLFSFQDILTSLIGVVFLIVLLLSLRLLHQIPSVSELSREEEATLNQEMQKMEIENQDLEKQIERWREKAQMVGSLPEMLPEELHQLSQQREDLSNQVHEETKRLEDLTRQSKILEEELQNMAQLLLEKTEEIKQLDGELLKTKTTEIFVFNPASGGKKPWLVDLGGDAWHVISPETFLPVQTFSQTSLRERTSAFLRWARTRKPYREYFVLFVRPGGLPAYDTLREELEKLNFELGVDLLGDNQSLVFKKGQGS